MSFDQNAIPPNARSKTQIAAHLELYNRTQDTVRVHNPSQEDFIVYNDRRFANERYVIPNATRDIGFGKGNNDVPRFIALRFVDKMGMEMITKMIKEDWDKKKGKYRLDEQGVMEERLALRSSDPKLWEKVTKELWVGVVKRYQNDIIEDLEPVAPRKEYGSDAEAALDRLDMFDSEIGVPDAPDNMGDDDINKQRFLEQVQ